MCSEPRDPRGSVRMPTEPRLQSLVANAPFARADAPYRLLEVKGPDAGDFLQRLCSQDVRGAAEGEVRPAAFLDNKGKVLATCLVFRLGDSFWLETQAEQADKLAALLERYHFTEKLAIALPRAGPCHELVLWGANTTTQNRADGLPSLTFERRGVMFVRSHGGPLELVRLAEVQQRAVAARPLTPDHAECLRMIAGLVRVGVETESTTLALEADLDDHISTTKGCYTGQEIVARIHTYGHTNRKLCLLWLAAGERITVPQPLHEPEEQLAVGRVMHAVPVPGQAARLGVGYLPKDFQAIGTKLTLADKSSVEVIGYEPLLPA